MGKLSVVTRVRSHLKSHLRQVVQSPLEEESNHLAQSCIKAAKKILRLYEDVRRTGNLTRFSFTDFQGCSVATSLVLLAGVLERDSDYDRHITFGLDSLQKMAEGNTTATAGLRFVEALHSITEEAVQKLRQRGVLSSATSPGFSQTSDYSTWADWLACQSRQPSTIGSRSRTPPTTIEVIPRNMNDGISEAAHTMNFTTWDGATALQQLSIPSMNTPLADSQYDVFSGPTMFDPLISTTDHSEDTMFLMGLTGFDMMGFGFQDLSH